MKEEGFCCWLVMEVVMRGSGGLNWSKHRS